MRYLIFGPILCISLVFSGCNPEPDENCSGNLCETLEDSDDAGNPNIDAENNDPDGSDTGNIDPDADVDPDQEEGCLPTQIAWENNAREIVESSCAECHGAEPQFGAPFSLLDYDFLVAGTEGTRPVDRMARELMDGDMPPPAYPPLSHTDLDTLLGWATCGAEHPDHSMNLEASAPVWEAPATPPAGMDYFDVTANEYTIGAGELDSYRCFAKEVEVDSPQLIRRIAPVIDDGRVLHHTVVSIDRSQNVAPGEFGCLGFPPGDDYIYAWGPGQGPIEFPEGGIRIEPGDVMVLQIHYNNGAGIEDVSDSSGIRLYHEDPQEIEYAQAQHTTSAIFVPPNDTFAQTTTCNVNQEVDLIAAWPHMHEIGSEFSQIITRQDDSTETIIELTGWHFEAQFIYHTPTTLYPGDQITLRCAWDNPNDHPVYFGTGTEDEMCFSFMYVTPAHSHFCD